ncbi:unnamed protein product [Effrenium voratum]|nr:unnamed protein product [Effrenium voratum]
MPMPRRPSSSFLGAQKTVPRMVHLKPVVPLCDQELLGWLAQVGVQSLTRISEEEVALEVADPTTIAGLVWLQGLNLGPFRLQVALDGRWPKIKDLAEPETVCDFNAQECAKTLMNEFLSEEAGEAAWPNFGRRSERGV